MFLRGVRVDLAGNDFLCARPFLGEIVFMSTSFDLVSPGDGVPVSRETESSSPTDSLFNGSRVQVSSETPWQLAVHRPITYECSAGPSVPLYRQSFVVTLERPPQGGLSEGRTSVLINPTLDFESEVFPSHQLKLMMACITSKDTDFRISARLDLK